MNLHRVITVCVILAWVGYVAWVMNTPEHEPECKPVPQLSEILK